MPCHSNPAPQSFTMSMCNTTKPRAYHVGRSRHSTTPKNEPPA